jgi:plasmid stability protein
MSDILVRGVDEVTKAGLVLRAKRNNRSMNAEINALLCAAGALADKAELPTPAHKQVADEAIRQAVQYISQAPSTATAKEREDGFYAFLNGWHGAILTAVTNGASIEDVASAVTGEDFTDYFAENAPPMPINRTAVIAPADWDPKTGLSIGVVDRT